MAPESQAELEIRELRARVDELEQALAQKRVLPSLLELDACPLLLLELDREGRIQWANSALKELLGTEKNIINKDWFTLAGEKSRRESDRQSYEDFIRTGHPAHHTTTLVRADDARFTIRWSSLTLSNQNGTTRGTLNIGENITSSAELLTDLRGNRERYLGILGTAVDAIITIDVTGIVREFNRGAERIFGYSAAEIIGEELLRLMPSPYREEHDDYLRNYLETGQARIIGSTREVIGLRKDGSTFPGELAVSESIVGREHMFTGIVRDLSELRRAQVLAEVGTLASGLAHEVGTPLSVILGRAERLRDRTQEETTARALDVIIRQVERAERLIRQLLTFTRTSPMQHQNVNLKHVLDLTLEVVEERSKRNHIDVIPSYEKNLPTIKADPDQLSQVALNLIINAIDAMPHGGQLTTGLRTLGTDAIELEVTDTGFGISEEHLARIFEPFFTTKETGKGTGLGLAVVQRIVQDHGGSIQVKSDLGAGSTFRVRLPKDHLANR